MKKMCCNPKVIIIALLAVFALVFFTPLKATLLPYLPLLVVLICPLSMFGMMFMMKGKDKICPTQGDQKVLFRVCEKQTCLFTCPECRLSYKDKTWAEKCEKWCGERHSCNLDITKHAIKNEIDA